MSELVINRLPGRTFRWLAVNETVLSGFEAGGENNCVKRVYEIPENQKSEEPERISFVYGADAEKEAANEITVKAGKGSESVFVLDCRLGQPESNQIDAFLSLKLQIEEQATVKLIQLHRLQEGARLVNRVQAECADNGKLKLVQFFLGDGAFYQDLQCELTGYQSAFQADAAYLIQGKGTLDINYVATHHGRKTASDIHFDGVLRDTASKIFRGTIDFKNGAVNAVGAEKEDVLLMDPGVSNKTVPLILCAEENVSGTHGATIGKLGKELLFYLESRGMTREEIYEMMARARMDAVASKIEDEQLRAWLLREVLADFFGEMVEE